MSDPIYCVFITKKGHSDNHTNENIALRISPVKLLRDGPLMKFPGDLAIANLTLSIICIFLYVWDIQEPPLWPLFQASHWKTFTCPGLARAYSVCLHGDLARLAPAHISANWRCE
jgi:hypothetical protein